MIFDLDGHISKNALSALAQGTLSEKDALSAALHASECPDCALLIAGACVIDPPAGFAEAVALRAKQQSKRRKQSLWGYSIRVSLAAAAACAVLVAGALGAFDSINPADIRPPREFAQNLSSSLNSFSQNLLHMEVFNNEKEK